MYYDDSIYPDSFFIHENPVDYMDMIPKDFHVIETKDYIVHAQDFVEQAEMLFVKGVRIRWYLRFLRLALATLYSEAHQDNRKRFKAERAEYNRRTHGEKIKTNVQIFLEPKTFNVIYEKPETKPDIIRALEFKELVGEISREESRLLRGLRWGRRRLRKKKAYLQYNLDQIGKNLQTETPALINKFKNIQFEFALPPDIEYQMQDIIADLTHRLIEEKKLAKKVKTLYEFPNGWRWFYIGNIYDAQEARAMKHCGREAKLYSLREPVEYEGALHWRPHVTIGTSKSGVLRQVYGYQDQTVAKKYLRYVAAFLSSPDYVKSLGNQSHFGGLSLSDFSLDTLRFIFGNNPNLYGIVAEFILTGDVTTETVKERTPLSGMNGILIPTESGAVSYVSRKEELEHLYYQIVPKTVNVRRGRGGRRKKRKLSGNTTRKYVYLLLNLVLKGAPITVVEQRWGLRQGEKGLFTKVLASFMKSCNIKSLPDFTRTIAGLELNSIAVAVEIESEREVESDNRHRYLDYSITDYIPGSLQGRFEGRGSIQAVTSARDLLALKLEIERLSNKELKETYGILGRSVEELEFSVPVLATVLLALYNQVADQNQFAAAIEKLGF